MGIIPCDGHQLRHIHCRPVIMSFRFSSYCIEKATHDYSEYTLCTALCLVLTGRRVVNLVATLAALLRPGEVSHGDDEEAVKKESAHKSQAWYRESKTDLLELSAIPASALYQAAKAAMRPKAPPATMQSP
jgi:hypothetical protein